MALRRGRIAAELGKRDDADEPHEPEDDAFRPDQRHEQADQHDEVDKRREGERIAQPAGDAWSIIGIFAGDPDPGCIFREEDHRQDDLCGAKEAFVADIEHRLALQDGEPYREQDDQHDQAVERRQAAPVPRRRMQIDVEPAAPGFGLAGVASTHERILARTTSHERLADRVFLRNQPLQIGHALGGQAGAFGGDVIVGHVAGLGRDR